MQSTCSIETCELGVFARGWCSRHYRRWKQDGDPEAPSKILARDGTCEAERCEAPITARRLCNRHYKQREYRQKRDSAAPEIKTCPSCKREFEQPLAGPPMTYCSETCRNSAKYARRRAGRRVGRVSNCLWCEADITGLRADAKFCSDPCANRWDFQQNAERITASARRYAEEHPDKVREAQRRYTDRHREKIYARQKSWQRANRDHHKAYQADYQRRYALAFPEKVRLHTANRSARKRTNGGGALVISERDWSRLLNVYRNRCAYCSTADDTLQIEHVVPLARGGRHSVGNVVPACAPCNLSKNDKLLVEWRHDRRRRRKKARAA